MASFQGSIREVGLPGILSSLTSAQESGQLHIEQDQWAGDIALDGGRVIGAAFGPERGLSALDALVIALPRGNFVFSPDVRGVEHNIDVAPGELLEHVEALATEAAALSRVIPSLAARPRIASAAGNGEVVLDNDAVRTLLAVDGEATIAELAAQQGLIETARHLACLLEHGLIAVDDEPATSPIDDDDTLPDDGSFLPVAAPAAQSEVERRPAREPATNASDIAVMEPVPTAPPPAPSEVATRYRPTFPAQLSQLLRNVGTTVPAHLSQLRPNVGMSMPAHLSQLRRTVGTTGSARLSQLRAIVGTIATQLSSAWPAVHRWTPRAKPKLLRQGLSLAAVGLTALLVLSFIATGRTRPDSGTAIAGVPDFARHPASSPLLSQDHMQQVAPERPVAVISGPLRPILDESFANDSAGWSSDPAAGVWLEGGAYHLVVRQPRQFLAVRAPTEEPLSDVVVRATFRKVGGPPGGAYGLIVRDQVTDPLAISSREGQYFALLVNDAGEYAIWRREGDRWIEVFEWTGSDLILRGDAANDLTVQVVGEELMFIVRDRLVASVVGVWLQGGKVGAIAVGDRNEVNIERFAVLAHESR